MLQMLHILPSISRNKGIQTLKRGQLVEYNIKNIFLGKLYTTCCGENSIRSFSEKLKLRISLNKQSKVLYSLLLLYVKSRTY